ncbi:CRISPR-associated protein Cas4 [Dyadobacter sp. LHD-138]|uniref:CRISPR-associated protein Cas4 n=1 Tax=Dyadobacter sp. LHD-138 TaxID=3071413 RepID=UPI0027DFFAD0|nr:CRISPR-associated protein Cas4 [Dyadobacter sp. LHD-138]MDQ6477254.1 CRISPR-associated protein Cas4 [Dyadobacter sp. LHD-138]
MNINATLINLYHVCKREMWLHAHAIRMEHTSDIVYEGKLIGETTYPQRAERYTEVEISVEPTVQDGIGLAAKIDFYDPHNGVVHEVKKSAAKEQAHIAQVQFYMYVLRRNGIKAEYGIIEYPKLRQTERVELDKDGENILEGWITNASRIIESEQCPPLLAKPKCKSCSYFDFCWSGEE